MKLPISHKNICLLRDFSIASLAFGLIISSGSANAQMPGLDKAIQDMNTANTALIAAGGAFSSLSVGVNGIRAGQEMFKKLILGGI